MDPLISCLSSLFPSLSPAARRPEWRGEELSPSLFSVCCCGVTGGRPGGRTKKTKWESRVGWETIMKEGTEERRDDHHERREKQDKNKEEGRENVCALFWSFSRASARNTRL